jgi:hypothetical protein
MEAVSQEEGEEDAMQKLQVKFHLPTKNREFDSSKLFQKANNTFARKKRNVLRSMELDQIEEDRLKEEETKEKDPFNQ